MESTHRQRAHHRAVNAWGLYYVGNSTFTTTIIAAVFPVYFSIIAGTLEEGLPPAYLDIHRYRGLFLFLIAFWLYNDGVGTIMKLIEKDHAATENETERGGSKRYGDRDS